jgi:hypothetical protein
VCTLSRAYIYEFDNDPRHVSHVTLFLLTLRSRFLERITSGGVEITADQFPNFLYDEINSEFPSEDEEWDVEHGLLHSSLCLWVHSSAFSLKFDVVPRFIGL